MGKPVIGVGVRVRRTRLLGLFALWAACLASAQTPPGSKALIPVHMHASFMRSHFAGVNEADAQAAFKAFAVRMGEKRGYAITPHVHITENAQALLALLKRQTIDMAVVDSWEYLTLDPIVNMPATFSAMKPGRLEDEAVVLVRRADGISGLADLAGKRVIVTRLGSANVVYHWFRAETMALDRGMPEQFYGHLEVKSRVSQAVLPVFFGTADACAVDRKGFETMVEMNPQIGKTLRPLMKSDPYLEAVCCMRLGGPWERANMRKDMIDAMLDLPNDPAGRQIMLLFRFGGVVPFEDGHLQSMRALRKRHDALLARATGDSASARGTGTTNRVGPRDVEAHEPESRK
jgi:ABC-type phosphate/phosphonate transport system substrate-binding protein